VSTLPVMVAGAALRADHSVIAFRISPDPGAAADGKPATLMSLATGGVLVEFTNPMRRREGAKWLGRHDRVTGWPG
jgi:hypothetical protein